MQIVFTKKNLTIFSIFFVNIFVKLYVIRKKSQTGIFIILDNTCKNKIVQYQDMEFQFYGISSFDSETRLTFDKNLYFYIAFNIICLKLFT